MYDILVIGAGPGGYPAAIRAGQLGLKVACVEKEKLGGVCLNWGCIPSKALLKTAELVHKIEAAGDFGVTVSAPEIDFAAVVKRSRKVADRFGKGVKGLFKKYGVETIFGTAKLVAPGAVEVDGKRIEAKHIIVATGAGPKTFPGIVPDGERILTYRAAILSEELPERITILGAGAIGMEFAYFWCAMGAEVTVVEGMNEIMPMEDVEVATAARKELKKQGIKFVLGQFVKETRVEGNVAVAELADGTLIESDRILVALGIRPNTDGVGLDDLGVAMERGFVVVDASMRTNVPGIYAVGDCCTKGGLAHTATRQAHVCVDRIAGHDVQDIDYDSIPACTYCQPQVASVGLTEKQATERGISYDVGRFPFIANGKAWGGGHPEGFVKVLIGKPYGDIVGAHIVGSEATEMIAAFTVARTHEAIAESYSQTVHAHPTHGEAMMEAVAQAIGACVHL
jgi:dihydrolipoamide dehydrogenase